MILSGATQKQEGFSLLELLVTLAVVGVLATVALPNLASLVRGQHVKTAAYDLVIGLQFARSEAVKRNGNVVVTPATGGWQNGWAVTSGTTVLRSQGAYNKISVSGPTSLTYNKNGRVASSVSISLDTNPASGSNTARCVQIDTSGRPVTAKGICS